MNHLQSILMVFLGQVLSENPTNADWSCRNDLEIQCTHGSCKKMEPEETSPMSLLFTKNGEISLCAYSGCWNGRGKVLGRSPFLVIAANRVPWSFRPQKESNAENVVLALDAKDGIAMVKAGGFSMPFVCKERVHAQ